MNARPSQNDLTPKILHRDPTLVVIHKPAGMTVYREPGSSGVSALDWLKTRVGGASCHPVHRLDKGTCGVLVFALSPSAASLLQKLFREGKVEKRYQALVHGIPPHKGEFRDPLPDSKSKEMRSARTRYRVLGTRTWEGQEISLVEVDPQTGRFHQIRRHFSMHGFPLVGDEKYASDSLVIWARKVLRLKRPALSAVQVSFQHPRTRRILTVDSQPDQDFMGALRVLESANQPDSR